MTDSTDSAGFVEVSGGIIIARMRGTPDAASLRDVQERILVLMSDTGINRILYDALELEAPSVDEVLVQQQLTEEFKARGARVALLVPNTRIAYLARLAFGHADHRVVYNDLSVAVRWLSE